MSDETTTPEERKLHFRLGRAAGSSALWSEAQRDGRACVCCGDVEGAMVPVALLDGSQVFAHETCGGEAADYARHLDATEQKREVRFIRLTQEDVHVVAMVLGKVASHPLRGLGLDAAERTACLRVYSSLLQVLDDGAQPLVLRLHPTD